jgi:hypothetical protein
MAALTSGRRAIRAAIAAPVEGDDPAVAGEAGDLHLPATRMDDRPRRDAGNATGPGNIPILASPACALSASAACCESGVSAPLASTGSSRSQRWHATTAVRAIWRVEGVVWQMRRVRQGDVVAQPGRQHRDRGPGGHDHDVMTDNHETTIGKARPTTLTESWRTCGDLLRSTVCAGTILRDV